MAREEALKEKLETRFAALKDKVRIQRVHRVWVTMEVKYLAEVLRYAVNEEHFAILSAITGNDLGATFGVIYHLSDRQGMVLSLGTEIPRENPKLKSIVDLFGSADIYERELEDLFGIQMEGLPPGNRYPLPDTWPQGEYPLRKDWKKNLDNLTPAKGV